MDINMKNDLEKIKNMITDFEKYFPIVIKSGMSKSIQRAEGVPRSIFNCREVPVEGTSFSKLVTSDGLVAVVLTCSRTGGWSSSFWPMQIDKQKVFDMQKQMLFDSRLIQFVSSEHFEQTYFKKHLDRDLDFSLIEEEYKTLMKTIFPDNYERLYFSLRNFSSLRVEFVRDVPFDIDDDGQGGEFEVYKDYSFGNECFITAKLCLS